ncbi:MAG: epoxyqueuosine reductase [Deltaproteobacteria bacterium]|nr:epoxyqueuosine reductase [Deltaproteobacteria bacterium]
MSVALKKSIIDQLGSHVTAVGFAPANRFKDAPEKHHPTNACKDAQTVIVFGITMPQGMLHSPDYNLHFLHRTYHTVYMHLDKLGLDLCNFIESQGDYFAVPIPSFAPLVYHDLEPWGIISLKHAAVHAGLGAFGRSGLMCHPVYGSLLRLGAVVTSADLPGDPVIEEDPCPPKCNACQEVCPSEAFDSEGGFNKLTCMGYCIKHAIYPIALKDEQGLKNIERIIHTAGYNYWLKCDECLKVCPNNQPKGS